MGEVISGPFPPDARRQAAEDKRQSDAVELRSEAEAIRTRLRDCAKIPHDIRRKFALHCHRMFERLDALGRGEVAAVLKEAVGDKGEHSKRRGRFAQEREINTKLTARGSQWETLVRLASERLGTRDREFIELVAGTKFSERTDSPLLTGIGEAAAEIAGTLDLMVRHVARRHGLADYFETLRYCPYVLLDDRIRVPDTIPLAADMDRLEDGLWVWTEDESESAFLPKVPLFEQHASIPCHSTVGEFSSTLAGDADIQEQLQALADDEGLEEGRIELVLRVSLAVAPLGRDRSPAACFLVEPTAWLRREDEAFEIFQAPSGGWIEILHRDRWFGLRAGPWSESLRLYEGYLGHYRLEVVGRENCLRLLRPRLYGEGLNPLVGGADAEAADRDEALAPTAAPGMTMMAVIQRNLTAIAEDHRISTLLDADAARLTRLLADAQADDRDRYHRAIQPLIDRWKADNETDR